MFFLVRHAAHDNVGGFLAGREKDVHLGAEGRAQAERLARRMGGERFEAIHTSPRIRTRETAQAIAAQAGMEPEPVSELDEIDFGQAWCGRTFDELNSDPAWRAWNVSRGLARTPAGESMLDVQARIVGHMQRQALAAPDRSIVLVSHADVLKAAIVYWIGLSIAAIDRMEISPASISRLVVGDWGVKLLGLNEVVS
jgi:broad specificity phosphatase PhoE